MGGWGFRDWVGEVKMGELEGNGCAEMEKLECYRRMNLVTKKLPHWVTALIKGMVKIKEKKYGFKHTSYTILKPYAPLSRIVKIMCT